MQSVEVERAKRKELLKSRLLEIEKRIVSLETDGLKPSSPDPKPVSEIQSPPRNAQRVQVVSVDSKPEVVSIGSKPEQIEPQAEEAPPEEKRPDTRESLVRSETSMYWGSQNFEDIRGFISQKFGSKENEEKKQDTLDKFIEDIGDVNYYTAAALLVLDDSEGSNFRSLRDQAKLVLLPCFQILIPLGLVWFFVVEKRLIENHGLCHNNDNFIFRVTGSVAYVYSAWQIIDGMSEPSSDFLMQWASKAFAISGSDGCWRAMKFFWMCSLTQQLCSFLLLLATYIVFTSASDTPIDLIMNCVALNFVLDVDSEWMDDDSSNAAKQSATVLFQNWHDEAWDNHDEMQEQIKRNVMVRKYAPRFIKMASIAPGFIIPATGYFLLCWWTFCPADM